MVCQDEALVALGDSLDARKASLVEHRHLTVDVDVSD